MTSALCIAPAPGAGLGAAEKSTFGDEPQFIKGELFPCELVWGRWSYVFVLELGALSGCRGAFGFWCSLSLGRGTSL